MNWSDNRDYVYKQLSAYLEGVRDAISDKDNNIMLGIWRTMDNNDFPFNAYVSVFRFNEEKPLFCIFEDRIDY